MVIIGHNTSEIQKLSFSRGALFDMKTIVGLKYFVYDYRSSDF